MKTNLKKFGVLAILTVLALMGASSMIGGARAAGTAVAVPTFSLTAQYKALNVSITNETTTHSGTINYVVHYSTSNSITNKTTNITTKNGQDYVEIPALSPGTTFYVAVDSVNGTAYSSLSSVQSAVVEGVFTFEVSQVKVVKVTKGSDAGDYNITFPIAALTGTSFNSMALYYMLTNVSSSVVLNDSPILAPFATITKTPANWTFNDVSLPSGGSVFLYSAYNFSVSSGPYVKQFITQVGSPAYKQGTGSSGLGFFAIGSNGALALFLNPLGVLILVAIAGLVIYVIFKGGEHEEKEKERRK